MEIVTTVVAKTSETESVDVPVALAVAQETVVRCRYVERNRRLSARVESRMADDMQS